MWQQPPQGYAPPPQQQGYQQPPPQPYGAPQQGYQQPPQQQPGYQQQVGLAIPPPQQGYGAPPQGFGGQMVREGGQPRVRESLALLPTARVPGPPCSRARPRHGPRHTFFFGPKGKRSLCFNIVRARAAMPLRSPRPGSSTATGNRRHRSSRVDTSNSSRPRSRRVRQHHPKDTGLRRPHRRHPKGTGLRKGTSHRRRSRRSSRRRATSSRRRATSRPRNSSHCRHSILARRPPRGIVHARGLRNFCAAARHGLPRRAQARRAL